jgi:hypothetical protein
MLEFPSFYIDVVGEGEETLAELCDAIAKGNDLNTRIRLRAIRTSGHWGIGGMHA